MTVSYPSTKRFSTSATSANPTLLLLNEGAFIATIAIPIPHRTVRQ